MIHIFLIIMILTYIILIVGYLVKSEFLVSLCSIGLISLGIYGIAYGIPYNNGTNIITYTNGTIVEKPIVAYLNDISGQAMSMITLFIGLFFLVVANLQWIWDELT